MFSIVHPGIQNHYQFTANTEAEAYDLMRKHLEDRHGGLASGMLASCQIAPVITSDLPSKGRAWNTTRRDLHAQGLETSDVQTERSLYFYEDAHGNPEFFVEGMTALCDHGDPDHDNDPICMDCALAASSNIYWQGDPDYSNKKARKVYRLLPKAQRGECWSCRATLSDF